MNNNVYLLWVAFPELGIEKYLDSIWENENDLNKHIVLCLKDGYLKDSKIEIETKQLYKHF